MLAQDDGSVEPVVEARHGSVLTLRSSFSQIKNLTAVAGYGQPATARKVAAVVRVCQ
jgi:hypothetical protein